MNIWRPTEAEIFLLSLELKEENACLHSERNGTRTPQDYEREERTKAEMRRRGTSEEKLLEFDILEYDAEIRFNDTVKRTERIFGPTPEYFDVDNYLKDREEVESKLAYVIDKYYEFGRNVGYYELYSAAATNSIVRRNFFNAVWVVKTDLKWDLRKKQAIEFLATYGVDGGGVLHQLRDWLGRLIL